MASEAYGQILMVQDLDLKLAQLRHRHAHHPLRSEIANANTEVAQADALLAQLDERKADLDRVVKRLSDEVATLEDKRASSDGKLYDGSITASKELLALQSEVASLLERQRGLEDEELELMEQLEELDAERGPIQSAKEAWLAKQAEAEAALVDATAEIDVEIEAIIPARATAAESAVPDLLARYESLAPQFDGVAVAQLEDGRCNGCHMQLSAVAVDQLGKAPDDAVVQCEECGRLLVR